MEIWLFLFAITNNTTMKILTSFGEHANVFLLSTSLGIEWLGQMVCICLALVHAASFLKNLFKPP